MRRLAKFCWCTGRLSRVQVRVLVLRALWQHSKGAGTHPEDGGNDLQPLGRVLVGWRPVGEGVQAQLLADGKDVRVARPKAMDAHLSASAGTEAP